MTALRWSLPWPTVTTNKLYTQTVRYTKRATEKRPAGSAYVGRSLSRAAVSYADQVCAIVRNGGMPKPPPGLLSLKVDEYPPDHRHHDVDGVLKLLQDSIAAALQFDDYRIVALHVRRHPPTPRARLEVCLETDTEAMLT